MFRLLLFLILLFSSLFTFAADKIHPVTLYKHYGEEEGLTTKTVYSITQDKEGFLWFATDAGVFRYDGKNFRHFTVDDGLTDNEIFKIYQDKHDRIWFLTLNGILSYWYKGTIFNGTNTPFLRKANLGSAVSEAFEDHSGRIWFGCKMTGLITIDDTIVNTIPMPKEGRPWSTPFVYEDINNVIWYFYKDCVVNLDRHDTIKLSSGIYSVSPDQKNRSVYYLNIDGVFKIENGINKKLINNSEFPPTNKVINLLSHEDTYWICTLDEGCFQFRNSKFEKRYLENSSVTSVMVDREGNYWFSTINDGVYMLSKNNDYVSNYTKESGLSGDKAISIVKGNDQTTWIGYNNGIVDKISGNTKLSFDLKKKNDPDFFRITSLLYWNDTLWCGTDLGTYMIIKDKIYTVYYFDDGYFTHSYAIKQLLRFNNLVYAGNSHNFIKFDKNRNNEMEAFNVLDSIVRTFSGVKLNDSSILVSCASGLMEVNPGKNFIPFTNDSELTNIRVLDMKFDSDSLLILSTNNKGLFVMKGNKIIQHITTAAGLTDNNCSKFNLTSDQLFVSTSNGVSILKKEKGRWIFHKSLTIQNGLLSNNINDIYVGNDKIFIASDKGLSIISRSFEQSTTYNTNVVITDIVTNSSQEVISDNYSFNSDIPRLRLRFSYPVFTQMNKIQLKYRLIDQSNKGEWINTENNEVEFSSLNPGNYTFQVMPDLVEGKITTLKISIIPKWWQTLWARIIIALVIGAILLYILRRKVKSQYENQLAELKHESMIESERNRIASDMHDDIGGDLTQISIWLNIMKQKKSIDNTIVQKVTRLSNEVLSKMDQIIWALDSVHNRSNDLFSYLHSFASENLESSDITLDFKLQEGFPELRIGTFQRRNVFLVMKELLHNSIKHSNASKVSININYSAHRIIIEYTDNGQGYSNDNKGEGLGMITMQKRMSEIKANISLESSPGKGFSAYLSIPIDSNNNLL